MEGIGARNNKEERNSKKYGEINANIANNDNNAKFCGNKYPNIKPTGLRT
jgi:hypothetical protein